jgi:23S rRNA (adenine2503-C2)-methyltransferase
LGISHRKISLSTCGLIKGIERLEKENLNINLMISLNASSNKKRNLLMPVNKKYPLEKLMSVCREFTLNSKNQITFEYVLIKNVNDSEQDAEALVSLIKGIRCKINLIPFNKRSDENWPYDPPEKEKVNKFQEYLISQKYLVFLRKQRGLDISASCGQLTGQK